MNVSGLIQLIVWAAVFGVAVIFGTRFLSGLARKVRV